jgi:hypothetical protein
MQFRLIKNGTRNEDYANFDAGADTSLVITISYMSFGLIGAEWRMSSYSELLNEATAG